MVKHESNTKIISFIMFADDDDDAGLFVNWLLGR